MMRENMGNLLRVIHETGCTLEVAREALANNNSWPNTYKYARERMQTNNE